MKTTCKALLIGLVAILTVTVGAVAPAQAKLAAVGPIDPNNGFPFWYEDASGTRLDLCLDPQDQLCLQPFEMPDPAGKVSFPDNFPGEAFWWTGEASIDRPNGGRALLVLAMEAAFANEEPVEGDQMSFGRVRIRLDGLVPGETYTVTHPYGTDELVAEGDGSVFFTEDIGCFPSALRTCNFENALSGRVGPFLKWDAGAPAGYVGDPNVAHTVVGSPITDAQGNPQNYFKVEGPNVGGPGVNVIQTDQFLVSGKLARLQVSASPRETLFNSGQEVKLVSSAPADIYYTTDGSDPSDPANANRTLYTGPFNIEGVADQSQDVTLKFVAVNANTNESSGVVTKVYTIDRAAPHLTASPEPGVKETPVDVSLTADKPADIFYTLDGSDPSDAANLGRKQLGVGEQINVSRSTTVKAVAVGANGSSRVETFKYTISSLSKVGPVNPQGGFPFWYEDASGTRLDLCLDPQDQRCLQPFEMPDPAGKVSFPDNFPGEAFWWTGEASTTLDNGADALLVLAQEAAFANEEPVEGDQMSFGRVRIRVDGLVPDRKYRITHPYGTDVYTATDDGKGGGEINITEDIGCFPAPGEPCDFNDARFGRVGPFLTWDTFGQGTDPALMGLDANGQPDPSQPDAYVGDPNVAHTVVGSPIADAQGNPQNYFKVEALNADGSATQLGFTDMFSISGKVYTLQVGASKAGGFYNAPLTGDNAVRLAASDPAATIYYTLDGSDPTTASPVYNGPISIDAMNQETTLKYMAVDAAGKQSGIYTETYTLDNEAPAASASPAGGTFENVFPTVELAATDNLSGPAKIYYTLDGSEPVPGGRNSRLYTDPIKLDRINTTLKFLAVDKAKNASAVATETYTIIDTIAPDAPSIDLAAASDSGPSNTDNVTNDATPEVTGQAEPNSTVRILSGDNPVGSGTASGDGSYSVTLSELTDGVHNLKATATDESNNTSAASAALEVTVDTAAPVASAPDHGFLVRRLAPRTVPVRISWAAATDEGGSGVVRYQLQQSSGGGPFANVALPSATVLGVNRQLAPNTYRFQIGATDKAGNTSGFAAGPGFTLTAQRETSPAITYAGAWQRQSMAGALDGQVRFATARGARATFRFTGSRVAWIAPRTANSGRAEVWLDGQRVATIDLYAASLQPRMPVFVRNDLAAGSHNLQIRVLGTKRPASNGTRVYVDGFMFVR